jgi:hypothetical protein
MLGIKIDTLCSDSPTREGIIGKGERSIPVGTCSCLLATCSSRLGDGVISPGASDLESREMLGEIAKVQIE